jgi:hypothetical protein
MNDDFEQRLRTLFKEDDGPAISAHFEDEVGARIARLRRLRRAALSLGWVTGAVIVAVLMTPLVGIGAAPMAAAPNIINDGLGALLLSPAAYVLGTLAAVAALVDAFGR